MRLKHALRSPLSVGLLSHLASAYIRLVLLTGRLERDVAPASEAILSGERQAVLAFWHARMLLLPAFKPPGRSMDVLISRHRDGVMISAVIRRFAIGTVAGSTSRGALSAVRGVMEKLSAGGNISITPDGPRGPARRAAPGIAHVASRTGLPVMPVAIMAARFRRLRSWDRFMIPLPFSRLAFVVGDPVPPAEGDGDAAREAFRAAIERALNEATDRADTLLGLPPEPPSPAGTP